MDGATVLTVVGSRIEAELIVGMLRGNGLRAALVADDAGAPHPHLQMKGIRVLVDRSEEDTARRLLAAAEDSAEGAAEGSAAPADVDSRGGEV